MYKLFGNSMHKGILEPFRLVAEVSVVHQKGVKVPGLALTLSSPARGHGWLSTARPSKKKKDSVISGLFTRVIDENRVDWSMVREWLHTCDTEHRDVCGRRDVGNLLFGGFQVIDCKTRKIIRAPERATYVALSYVWGSTATAAAPFVTRLRARAPSAIEDAIVCTRAIGLRYLWVDRYCIDQNDSEMKHVLIQRMDQIYRNASITIIR